jgi:hypothetical protein
MNSSRGKKPMTKVEVLIEEIRHLERQIERMGSYPKELLDRRDDLWDKLIEAHFQELLESKRGSL